MAGTESNVFPILNLDELTSAYKLYRIRGLDPSHPAYYLNRNHVERHLSYSLKAPALVIEQDSQPHLVVPVDTAEPDSPLPVVMGQVAFERCGHVFELDFTARSPENDAICLRFLQFLLQAPLRARPDLWQPRSGGPFYKKTGQLLGEIVAYSGFSVRSVVTPHGGIGLCVDATTCYVGAQSLPADLTREEFTRRWKNRRFIYHYGQDWYQIQATGISDFSVSEYMLAKDGYRCTLLSYLMKGSEKSPPPELTELTPNAAVILYRDNRGQERAAPAPLCYPVYGTEGPEAARHHNRSQLPPNVRRRLVCEYVGRYLNRLQFGSTVLQVGARPLKLPSRVFEVPDLRFGNGTVLSVRGTSGARQIGLNRLAPVRLELLQDSAVGFYETDRLYWQYLILPRSALETYGLRFVEDLKHMVNKLYPVGGYAPIVVTYDDNVPRKFVPQARALMEAIRKQVTRPGWAVVMVHALEDQALREEDELAALAIHQLREKDVRAAVIHTAAPSQFYELVDDGACGPNYVPKASERKRMTGYLRNVAFNKVLLTNRRLPFVLATRLHADLVVGIDVKNHTAGLSVVDAYGANFFTHFRESKQKECLLRGQINLYLTEAILEAVEYLEYRPQHVVIHRDGLVFGCEIEGLHQAHEALKREGVLDAETTFTVVEIPKTAPVPLRVFDITEGPEGSVKAENPVIGTYFVAGPQHGYLCTTGRPLLGGTRGTVRPLHIRVVKGPLSLEECLEDVFYLSSLTWTRPDGCMRTPITTKLLDRFLLEEAGEYDEDQLEFGSTEEVAL